MVEAMLHKRESGRRVTENLRTGPALRGKVILCVEDNPYGRVLLNTILTELGHRVDFAGTGEGAVAAVKRGGYDLVLMDVTLPVMDGLAATRAIRARSCFCSGVTGPRRPMLRSSA